MAIRVDLGSGSSQNWTDFWDFITQTGQQTGNNELQNYEPAQVKVGASKDLNIVLEKVSGNRYRSGKIRSKSAITAWAPEHGALEFEFVLPNNTMQNGTSPALVPGLWPAFWLLPITGNWPTGGEIDLVEMMQFRGQSPDTGFSTLHFGPSVGVDAVYDGHWGLRMGSFSWDRNQQVQKVRFEWQRTGGPGSPWRLTQFVNNKMAWSQLTTHVDKFYNFEKGKNFARASPRDFAAGAPGDPAKIFQRAFDEPRMGLHFIINLAFGGTPWNHDRLVDLGLQQSVMRVVSFRVWDMTAAPPSLPAQPSSPCVLTAAMESLKIFLGNVHALQERALTEMLEAGTQQPDQENKIREAAAELEKIAESATQTARYLKNMFSS